MLINNYNKAINLRFMNNLELLNINTLTILFQMKIDIIHYT